ncbi:unnamed protein product [Euphydryas editha]|nr:unnamed protein product [Euphydryas editha]
MEDLFSKLMHLDRERKSFYVSLTSLTSVLGAENIMKKLPNIVSDLISALHIQAVQASATTTLETLLQKHIQTCHSDVIFEQWIKRILIHVNNDSIDSAVMNILESLLVLALKLANDLVDYFLPHMQSSCASRGPQHARSALVCASALRRAGLLPLAGGPAGCPSGGPTWRGTLPYDLLRHAAVDCSEENRILCISLIVESPKTTEIFENGELELVLWFLTYNINAQEPHFRQQVLSIMNKFIKRLESSYKVLVRESKCSEGNKGQYYLTFVDRLRQFCFDSLVVGANYSRRHVALQLLRAAELLEGGGRARNWKYEEIETLLRHLGDSYEGNKALALELLCRCPEDMLKSKNFSTSLELNDILAEASSIKPTDCVTVVYKLKLLINKLPEHIVQGEDSKITSKVKFALLSILLGELDKQLSQCRRSLALAARSAPVYGLLRCAALGAGAAGGVTPDVWTGTIHRIVAMCEDVWACCAAVLSSAAPEGHLPARGACGSILLEDGKEVTAQMVLLCAWRSIKEVSSILGNLVSQVLLQDEFEPTTRSVLVRRVGELFTTLLTEIKHRGAFEQVYVGFTQMLTSLWRSRNPEFNELPKLWLEELMTVIESGDPSGKLCATRRSAGLPFMIQALVITELQVRNNPRAFDDCVARLLRLAGGGLGGGAGGERPVGPGVAGRCHALNTLRALVRDHALHERVAPHTAAALLCALAAFERDSWIERNSATLLFSALMVRIFGVQRTRDSENLCVRNRMTGRIFFLKYPKLYDFMLEKLKEVSEDNNERLLRPSLYPILLLLARLYPSSLEGTVSNLKLSAFVPLVRACARSAVLTTRRLAARAASALVEPERYISHVEEIFELINNRSIKMNYCHGLLLQLIKLLESKPERLIIAKNQSRLIQLIKKSDWILHQSLGDMPCYLIADEYIKMVNVLIWRFDALMEKDFIINIKKTLNQLIFNDSKFKINPGRELCLANAAYLHLIISHKYNNSTNVPEFVYKCLAHKHYEVTCAVLNYLLILNKVLELENNFHNHLNVISDDLRLFENDPKYIENLCRTLRSSKYLECTQKCLKLLNLKGDTAKVIIKAKMDENYEVSDDLVVDKLLHYIDSEHENLMHYYLVSLCNFLCAKMVTGEMNEQKFLEAMRVIFSCSLPNNSDETRMTVVNFLEKSLTMVPGLLDMNFKKLSEEDRFQARALALGAAASALHDDERGARHALARALLRPPALHTRAARALRAKVGTDGSQTATLSLLALLDFRVEVTSDDLDPECRVFDQNEKYNIYLEETIWTRDCARRIKEICEENDLCNYIYNTINKKNYRQTFEKLCGDNFTMFEKSINGPVNNINPKVKIFIDTLRST